MRFQDALDLVEHLAGHKRLVRSLAIDALPPNHARIYRVPEHPMHRALARGVREAVTQALLGKCVGQRVDGDRARGIALEGPGDERRLRIGLDHRLASPTAAVASDVPIAEGCTNRPAALSGFLVHALADLLSQVGRVELGDRGKDPLHELARGRVL